jgi:hypothetical protein
MARRHKRRHPSVFSVPTVAPPRVILVDAGGVAVALRWLVLLAVILRL